MPSKFDAVLPGLKPAPVADQVYQDKVNEAKVLYVDRHPATLAKLYTICRNTKAVLEEQLYQANLQIEALTQLLIEGQEAGAEGWGQYGGSDTTLRLPNGDKIETRSEPYGVVTDKEAFRLWCLANGYERQLMLWPTTTNKIVKERTMVGDPLPDGTDVFRKDSIRFTPMRRDAVSDEVRAFREGGK